LLIFFEFIRVIYGLTLYLGLFKFNPFWGKDADLLTRFTPGDSFCGAFV